MSEPGASAVITRQSGSEVPWTNSCEEVNIFSCVSQTGFLPSEGQNKPNHSSHTS